MTQITREELYDLVWTEPTKKLAERFCISDVGLAKACRRHRIPRPPRGYWAKVQHGKRVRRKPLPKLPCDQSQLAIVHLSGNSRTQGDKLIEQQKQHELDPQHRITVPAELVRPHRLLRPHQGRKHTLRGVLHKRLCQKCYNRGLRIADTLLQALDERGFESELPDQVSRDSAFIVQVHGQLLNVNISEQMERIEKKRRRLLSYYNSRDLFGPAFESYYESVCSGRLRLSIVDSDAKHVRRNWNETEKRSLEGQLNRFIVGLVVASRAKEKVVQQREEWRRQWQKERARRYEERRQQEEELQRITQLEEWVVSWERAERMRKFLDVLRDAWADDLSVERATWLDWATAYMNRTIQSSLAGRLNRQTNQVDCSVVPNPLPSLLLSPPPLDGQRSTRQ